MDSRLRSRPGGAGATVLLIALLSLPAVAPAQQPLRAPSGAELTFPRDTLVGLMQETRAYRDSLEQDPDILYYTGVASAVPADRPTAAYPWIAVEVQNDSVARIATPENLREANRAYFNYAVERMWAARDRSGGGDDPESGDCSRRMERERKVAEAFAKGWVVSRALYGAEAFPPLDELAFAWSEGHLEAFLAAHEPIQLAECAGQWKDEQPERMEAYREWRSNRFAGGGDVNDAEGET